MANIENYLMKNNTETTMLFGIYSGLLPLLMKSLQKCRRILEVYHQVHHDTDIHMLFYLFTNKFNVLQC